MQNPNAGFWREENARVVGSTLKLGAVDGGRREGVVEIGDRRERRRRH